MISKLSLAAVLALAGSAALAQSAPPVVAATSVEGCLKQAFELADKLEGRQLSDADLQRLEDMLTDMESHCESSRFADAASLGRDIQRQLDIKRE